MQAAWKVWTGMQMALVVRHDWRILAKKVQNGGKLVSKFGNTKIYLEDLAQLVSTE